MNKNLEEKIYSMSNSFLPLDMFYNDIRDNPVENYNKEQAYKDIEKIADFIIDLQSQLDQQKAMWQKLKEFVVNRIYYAGYDIQEHGSRVLTDIIDKMQELEGGDEMSNMRRRRHISSLFSLPIQQEF